MPESSPRPGTRHDTERHHERDPDPAEAADRPLEPRAPADPLNATEEDALQPPGDPHHRLNTPVGEPDPAADSDPYRAPTPDDDSDRASGTRGAGQGSEDR
ncbi:MAG TPA: hypothetical protein VFN55_03910 [Solirubrobacteraceae bacterium]|nr:hypothetical protein [Solirubrobacteraceae bacterium]